MIRRLYVHNFRCLENFELKLADSPTTLLIGNNGSGKSAVRLALELFQRVGQGTNQLAELLRRVDVTRGQLSIPVRFELEVELNGKRFDYRVAIEFSENLKEPRVRGERLTVDGQVVLDRDFAQVQLHNGVDGEQVTFAMDWHLLALPVLQTGQFGDPTVTLRTWLSRMLLLAPAPSEIGGLSERETLFPNRKVTNLAEWFSGLMAQWPAAYVEVDRYLRAVMPDLTSLQNPIRGNGRSLEVSFQVGDTTLLLPFAELSDGEKCYVIAALAVASNTQGPVFCYWDEPDNFLALSEVGHLVMSLRRAFKNGQLLVTSHNPEAIRQFSDFNTLLFHRRSHLEPTQVRKLTDLPVEGDLIGALTRGDLEP